MGSQTGKVLGLVIMIAVLAVVGSMAMLGTNGSLIVWNILDALTDWAGLIALGVALGIFYFFMPSTKKFGG